VCLNAASTLERTLSSVQEQTYRNVEHIVIDGESTDGSVDILRRHDHSIAVWTSEPDRGISHAMNKGAGAASGDYLIFINADDRLSDPDALERAVEFIERRPGYDFYAFCIHFGAEHGYRRRCSRPFDLRMRFKTGILHQGVLISTPAHHRLRGFDPNYSYALDYDYFLRAYLAGMRLRIVPGVIAFMSEGGLSTGSDWPSIRKRLQQERRIHFSNRRTVVWGLIYGFYWGLYLPFKRIKHSLAATSASA
jgi:glycosyltransferase involved in cell wall biosynthesis